MRPWRWGIGGVLGLFALWLVLALGSALPHVDARQRAALARLQEPLPALPGANGELPFLLLSRGVPEASEAEWLALAPDEARRALLQRPSAPLPQGFARCVGGARGCLHDVRAAPDAARATRDAHAARLARVERLIGSVGHVATPFASSIDESIPQLAPLHPGVRLDATLRVLEGDAAGGLARLCRHAQWWRTLHLHTNSPLARRIFTTLLHGAADSYAELRAIAAPDASPAAACALAFAPLRDEELDVCRVMRAEFEGLRRDLTAAQQSPQERGALGGLARRLAFDVEASLAIVAPYYAGWCEAPQRRDAAPRAEPRPTPPDACRLDGWLFNAAGCALAPIAVPPTLDHYRVALDLDGALRLLASADWLAQQERVDAARFAQRPLALQDARHRFAGSHCAPRVTFRPRVTRGPAPDWSLALPAPADCPPAPP